MEFLAPVRQGGEIAEARAAKTGERTYRGTATVTDGQQRPVGPDLKFQGRPKSSP